MQLLSSIRLVDQLSFWCEWFLDRCSGVEGEGDSDLLLPLEKLGLLTELIVVELLGCWCKFEDAVFVLTEGAQIDGTSFPPLQAASVLACAMLHKGVPIAVRLLGECITLWREYDRGLLIKVYQIQVTRVLRSVAQSWVRVTS